jgi:hypothetical protein
LYALTGEGAQVAELALANDAERAARRVPRVATGPA